MDRFTRNYLIILATLAVIVLVWVFYESPDVARLNAKLSENAELVDYPYRFRVLGLENGVATMSSPRSASFPAYRALAILYPQLRNEAPDSPAMMEAQQEMARVQRMARDIVADSEDVSRVVWVLDENWLLGKGIDPNLP